MLIPKIKFRDLYRKRNYLYLSIFFVTFGVLVSFKLSRSTFSASNKTPNIFLRPAQKVQAPATISPTPAPRNTPPTNIPAQTEAQRIKVMIGETRDFPLADGIKSIIVVAPEIAAANAKNKQTISISALKVGETLLIVSGDRKRFTYIIEVIGKPSVAERQNAIAEEKTEANKSRISGAFNLQYTGGFDGNPSLIRQKANFKEKLSAGKTLRFSSEMFKYFGTGQNDLTFAKIQTFGLNRISLGIDSPDKSIDILDSQIQLSQLYRIERFHYTHYQYQNHHLAFCM